MEEREAFKDVSEEEWAETLEEWREAGKERGRSIASWIDLPEIGSRVDRSIDWIGLGETIDSREEAQEYFLLLCSESESNGRQFSPFEFTASEINSLGEFSSEEVWEVFDEGIRDGFEEEWEERSKDHYNIEEN